MGGALALPFLFFYFLDSFRAISDFFISLNVLDEFGDVYVQRIAESNPEKVAYMVDMHEEISKLKWNLRNMA